jgi:two-component system, chemotaxis family, chemotaxis protein CheY
MANILIVDDAKVMRFHIKRLLTEMGQNVVGEAKDGFEAIDLYKETKPDFVTMDLEMPSSHDINSGIDAVKKLLEVDPKAVIVMISSQTDKEKVKEALKNGAVNYITKPITIKKLEEIISHLGF